jgi:nucleoid-associated protein YgaU
MVFNCPICNQAGLADYRTKHVICPQCNSDLKPYLLLNTISKIKNKDKINRFSLSCLVICCLILSFFLLKNSYTYHRIMAENMKNVQILQNSLNMYRSHDNSGNKLETNEIVINYKIKKGDSLWKIAKIYYGHGKLYKKIEEDNNLRKPYSLKVGQLLNIKYYPNEWKSSSSSSL